MHPQLMSTALVRVALALGCICVHQAVPVAAVTLTTGGAAAAMTHPSSGGAAVTAAATLRANVSSLCGRDGKPNTSVAVTYSGVAMGRSNDYVGLWCPSESAKMCALRRRPPLLAPAPTTTQTPRAHCSA